MPTLAELRTAVRTKIDRVNAKTPSDADLTEWVNESAAELWDLLVTRYEDQFTKRARTTTAQGSTIDLSDLPTLFGSGTDAFFKLRGVQREDGGDLIPLQPVPVVESAAYARGLYSGGLASAYMLLGTTIYVLPDTAPTSFYMLYYVPAYTALVGDTDNLFTVPNNWHEYVVADVCIKARGRFQEDASLEMARKAELRRRIVEASSNRTPGASKRIALRSTHREDN